MRAIASDCFGEGSFTLHAIISRGISTKAVQWQPHVSHAPTPRQPHCTKGRRIPICAQPQLGPISSGRLSPPLRACKPRSHKC